MSKRIMVDLETLSTEPNAVVAAIGLVMFNDREILSSTNLLLDIREDEGDISPATLKWWLTQDLQVMREQLGGGMEAYRAAAEVQDWMHGADEVWGNAPTFDCTILRNWLERNRAKVPWHFRDERCCRTMFAIGRQLNVPYPVNTRKHDAEADAWVQAEYVLRVENAIRGLS